MFSNTTGLDSSAIRCMQMLLQDMSFMPTASLPEHALHLAAAKMEHC